MTTIRVETQLIVPVRDAVATVRPANQVSAYASDDPTMGELTWTPDLSASDSAAITAIVAAYRMQRPMDRATYDAVRTQMQVLRDLRQMGRNTFMGLSAVERDRALYDAFTAATQVFLSILRD